ncbi:hypothetical protein Tco_0924378 [Tanacetum coccineum]|uniref:Uncharacterized protein n=1 Tax=Tanacetum coccineum TaxID=301880 RepID=A0ABQ5DA08_9ASTR
MKIGRKDPGRAGRARGTPLTVEVVPSAGTVPESETVYRGVEESYDDAYSSYGTGTKYRDRSHGKDHSRSVKEMMGKVIPHRLGFRKLATVTESHWKSKAKRLIASG